MLRATKTLGHFIKKKFHCSKVIIGHFYLPAPTTGKPNISSHNCSSDQRRIKRLADLAAAGGPKLIDFSYKFKEQQKSCTDIANRMITHELNGITISVALIDYM
ncbi:hypothetical protein NPIL_493241 [Nephila pilipes]|uniref:Uncharacterized protein n=1 Tax=Nephila pilipes TaxID=299642 RepID=A0A8X6UNW2_NEPPI|nr:hypothetical protein NPIL_493241 [Nephila pilipes]